MDPTALITGGAGGLQLDNSAKSGGSLGNRAGGNQGITLGNKNNNTILYIVLGVIGLILLVQND